MAEREGIDETMLPLLSEVIDPDALNTLFTPTPIENQRESAYVSFHYANHRVVVYADQTITVT